MEKKILFAFPLKLSFRNGYWDQLYGSLRERFALDTRPGNFVRLLFSFSAGQIVHIHWASALYANKNAGIAALKFTFSVAVLCISRLRGDRVVWTMHNTHDHDNNHPRLDRLASLFLVAVAHRIIVHTEAGKQYVASTYNKEGKAMVIPHGNYIDFHGPRLEKPDLPLKRELGIGENTNVILAIGSIRKYKGLEVIIDSIKAVKADMKLLIAGKAYTDSYVKQLNDLATSQVIIYPRMIDHNELPRFFSIGFFSIFHFTEILTSGSVILSLSYGVPVIAPHMGDLPFIIRNGYNGYLYKSDEEMATMLNTISTMTTDEAREMGKNAIESVSRYDYSTIADLHANSYNLTV